MKSILLFFLLSMGISFTGLGLPVIFKNTSSITIVLKVPDVPETVLSANSETFMDLPLGQKIYFYVEGKDYLLLEILPEIKDQTIIINDLIIERKKELGLN